jgi:hypothetical protein
MQDKPGLGEQAINKMAELALASQLDESEELQVEVKVDPSNLAKGEVDSLAISGKGLVSHQDMRMEELDMQINSIAVKPLKAVFGKIELVKPTEGKARIVLTEADISRAFNSEVIKDQMYGLVVRIDGKPEKIEIQQVDCHLLSDGKIVLDAKILLVERSTSRQVSLVSTPKVKLDGQGVSLEDIQYREGTEPVPELTSALVERASEILNLHDFAMEDISLRIYQIDVEAGKLTLYAEALVTQLPSS